MISVNNYEIARNILETQAARRGIDANFKREDWDTFNGWKNRGKNIIKGSKGFNVEIVHPHLLKKNGKKHILGFGYRKTTLFLKTQTI